MDWVTAPLDLVRAAAVAFLGAIGFLLGLGAVLAIAHRDTAWLLTPVQKVVDGIEWAVWLLGVIWPATVMALPVLLLAGCGRSGGGTAGSTRP